MRIFGPMHTPAFSRSFVLRAAIAIIVATSLVPAITAGQSVQYRLDDGTQLRSLPDSGPVAKARRAYREATTLENALALGAAQSAVRDYRAALATYSEALEQWPDAAVLYRWRGHRRLTMRDFMGAKSDLATAIELDSTIYGG